MRVYRTGQMEHREVRSPSASASLVQRGPTPSYPLAHFKDGLRENFLLLDGNRVTYLLSMTHLRGDSGFRKH